MNNHNQNQSNLESNDDNTLHEEIIGQYVMELPAFGMKKHNTTTNQQRKKKVLKPIRQHTLSATRRRQCTSSTPYQTTYTYCCTRTRTNTPNVNNFLIDDHILRIKQLENALVEARMKTRELMTENRLLKTLEKRHENALSMYEGKQAKLPQVIKSYDEDIRMLQSRIRQMKISYKEMENRYKSQSNELLVLKKQYKHLLDLSQNKQLGQREKLSDQLEEAQIIIKERDNKIQNLMKQLDLQNKTHRHHINLENVKVKELQLEVDRLKNENQNQNISFHLDKTKTKSYSIRQIFTKGITENSISITPRVVKSVPSIHGKSDKSERSFYKTEDSISLKPESLNEKNDDNYSIKNFVETKSKQKNSNFINKSSNQIHNKPYSSEMSNNIAWQNSDLDRLPKKNIPELINPINNEFENRNVQITSDSSSVQKNSMSRKEKDLLIAKLNQVSEDQDSYGSYYQTKLLKQYSNKRYQSLDSNNESDESNSD